MRIRFVRHRKTGAEELRIVPGAKERLNLAQAQWLRSCDDPVLLPFDFERKRGLARAAGRAGRRVSLRYRVEERVSLRSYLSWMVVDATLLSAMLGDLLHVLELALRAPGATPSALYDSRHVFVDDAGRLCFALVPLEGVAWREDESPLALLRLLGDARRVSYCSATDIACAERLASFAEREGKAFSLNRYRAFLEGEFWQKVPEGERGALTGRYSVPASDGERPAYVLRDLAQGEEFALELGRSYVLGRGESCDVRLVQQPLVSRVHASLYCEREGVSLSDKGSTNGTFAAGRRIAAGESIYLPWGQEFSLSGARLRAERRAYGTGDQDELGGGACGARDPGR